MTWGTPQPVEIGGDEPPRRLQVAKDGTRARVVSTSSSSRAPRPPRAIAQGAAPHWWSPDRHCHGDPVLECLAGEDLTRKDPPADRFHQHRGPSAQRSPPSRHPRQPWWRNTAGSSPWPRTPTTWCCGEHAAAGALARAGPALDLEQLLVIDLAGAVLADCLEGAHHREITSASCRA